MKKALAILMVLAMVAGVAFAQTKAMPAPTVTAGLSASAEINVVKENTIASFETSGDLATPLATARPNGLKTNNFVINEWTNMDWAKMSVKTEGKYDAFRNNGDDWSWLKVTTTWKDFFGLEVKYSYAQDNKEGASADVTNGSVLVKNSTNEVAVTLDRTKDMGLKAYTVYNPSVIFGLANFNQTGDNMQSLFNGFKKIGFEMDNAEIAANLVILNTPVPVGTAAAAGGIAAFTIDTAKITAKDMFGKWTAAFNNADGYVLRMANLDSDSAIDRAEYKVGADNKLQQSAAADHEKMNVKNTIKFSDALSLDVVTVVPVATQTYADWFNATGNTNGSNLSLNVTYSLPKVAKIDFGSSVDVDYIKTDGATSAPSTYFGTAATKDWGTGIWLDANLSEMMGADKSLIIMVDGQFGSYKKGAAEQTKADAKKTTDVNELQVGGVSKWNIYGETKMKLSDALTVSAGTLFSLGMGYDFKAATDTSFSDMKKSIDDVTTNFVSPSFTEANVNNMFYGIRPFELKLRGDYIVNKTATVWLSNGFQANAGYYGDDGDAATTADLMSPAGNAIFGFYQKDAIELGVKLVATPKSTLKVSAGYSLFLGLPAASDLYPTGSTSDAKKAIDSAYAAWVSTNFNPFSAKIAYSYTY